MGEKRVRISRKAAIYIWPFTFDRSHPAEKECAEYIRAAPPGTRLTRMRRLILAGHQAIKRQHATQIENE